MPRGCICALTSLYTDRFVQTALPSLGRNSVGKWPKMPNACTNYVATPKDYSTCTGSHCEHPISDTCQSCMFCGCKLVHTCLSYEHTTRLPSAQPHTPIATNSVPWRERMVFAGARFFIKPPGRQPDLAHLSHKTIFLSCLCLSVSSSTPSITIRTTLAANNYANERWPPKAPRPRCVTGNIWLNRLVRRFIN